MAQAETGALCGAEAQREDMFVVGIGASAGGLEALQQFFRFMPANSGLSFVVIQHLAPDYKSLMADILGKYTQMSVLQAETAWPWRKTPFTSFRRRKTSPTIRRVLIRK